MSQKLKKTDNNKTIGVVGECGAQLNHSEGVFLHRRNDLPAKFLYFRLFIQKLLLTLLFHPYRLLQLVQLAVLILKLDKEASSLSFCFPFFKREFEVVFEFQLKFVLICFVME